MPEAVQTAAVAASPLRRIAGLRLIHLSFSTLLVLAMQTIFLIACLVKNRLVRNLDLSDKAIFVLVNYTVTILFFQVIGLGLRRWPTALRIANLLAVWLCAFMFGWHYYQGQPIDYVMVASISQLFHKESLKAVSERSSVGALIGMGALTVTLILITFMTRWTSKWPRPAFARSTFLGSIVVLTALTASNKTAFCHDLTYFVRTVANVWATRVEIAKDEYPYVHRVANSTIGTTPASPRPNVILVMMESFNADFVGRKNEAGQEFTPFFNALRSQGLYVEHFYGNSIQTPRGQEATLLSIPPSFGQKVAEITPPIRLRSLPAILRDHGYQTFYFQGHKSLEFDHAGDFMRRIGFDAVESLGAYGDATPEEKPYMWSWWGIQDDRLFIKGLEHVDRALAGAASRPDRAAGPFFVTFATITNHMMWNDVPSQLKMLYPNSGDKEHFKNFANSARLADLYLETLFAELEKRGWLKDSVVVIVGDHSYPNGQHKDNDDEDNFRNEVGFYEENFRT
ncbi:MAG: LTA synthase family protein, partial [Phycisphaerae bacterium]|nr:LTA synthase family protein [Phycisphaerae bacterium]